MAEKHGGNCCYTCKSHAELVALCKQRDDEINTWRERWKEEQTRRLELENGHSGNDSAPSAPQCSK